jgi:hypothetical protein
MANKNMRVKTAKKYFKLSAILAQRNVRTWPCPLSRTNKNKNMKLRNTRVFEKIPCSYFKISTRMGVIGRNQ